MNSQLRTPKFGSPSLPSQPQPEQTEVKRQRLKKFACSILLASSAFFGADTLSANSSTVTVPVSGNGVTFAILANPYNHGGNTLGEIFSASTLPKGTRVCKYNVTQGTYTISTFNGAWSNPNLILNAGEGFFLSFISQAALLNGPNVQINFSGDLASSIPLPDADLYALLGSPFDRPGRLVHDLGYPVSEGDVLYRFDAATQSYVSDQYENGRWDSGSEPRLGLGEGFFVVRGESVPLPSQWAGTPVAVTYPPGQCLSALPLGTGGDEYGQAVAVDHNGNVFVGGVSSYHPFLAKRDAGGALLWSLVIPGAGSGRIQAVAADASGNVYITGYFYAALDFGGGPVTSAGGYDIFVAKYSPTGAYQWCKRFGSPSMDSFMMESGYGLAVDPNDNGVVVTGIFNGGINFGGSSFTSQSGETLFLVKFAADGRHVWSSSVGGASSTVGNSVGMDASGNVFVTGSFTRTADFGSGPVTAQGSSDMFIAKYGAGDGAVIWVKSFGTNLPYGNLCVGTTLGVDRRTGDVVVAGNYQAAMSFGGQVLKYSGYNDIFLAKYSGSNGAHLWSTNFGGAYNDTANAVAVDNAGNITLVGQLGSRLDFGLGALPGVGGVMNIYVVNFSPESKAQWSKSFAVGQGSVRSIAASDARHWFVAGAFSSTVDFGCGSVTSAGGNDAFVCEFAP